MEIERFETLAEAYGGDIRRWPAAERDAAQTFRAAEPDAARRVLESAEALDAALDEWRTTAPSMELRDRILANAPKARAGRQARPHGIGFWLSGAGFAAVAAAGVIVGFAASNAVVSDARADALLSSALANEGEAAANPFTIGQAAQTS